MAMILVLFLSCVNGFCLIYSTLLLGRDALVGRAVGIKKFGGTTYWTTAKYMAGLLAPGKIGRAHV